MIRVCYAFWDWNCNRPQNKLKQVLMSWLSLLVYSRGIWTVPHTSHTPGGRSTTEPHPQPAFSVLFCLFFLSCSGKTYTCDPITSAHCYWPWGHSAHTTKTGWVTSFEVIKLSLTRQKNFFYHKCNKSPLLTCLSKDWRNEKPPKPVGTTYPNGELSTAKPPRRCFLGDNSGAPIVQKWERKKAAFLTAVNPSNTRDSLPVTMIFWRNNGFACSSADRHVAQLQC